MRVFQAVAVRCLMCGSVGAMALVLFGCQNPLAQLMVGSPNRHNPIPGDVNPVPPIESLAVDQTFRVPVGPPEANLSVSVIEPKPKGAVPVGTVLVVHGIFGRSATMLRTGHMLADAGYRAVLMDLRGHGRSTGNTLGFGDLESRDLMQVIDELEKRKLTAGKIAVYGISYGATTAIHLAGNDPRITAVVAVAPFSNIREEVPHFSRTMVPGLGWLIPERVYQDSIDEAGRLGNFNPDLDTAEAAIRRTKAQVLIIHGKADMVVPYQNGVRLHEAAPDHSELVSLCGIGHTTAWLDPMGDVAKNARDWLNRWLLDRNPVAAEPHN